MQNAFTYTPHGTPDSAAFPYLFTGRDLDVATGLQYNRARWYHPGTGRFISEDPIGILGGSANLYLYGLNSPTNLTDPWGLEPGGGCAFLCGLLGAAPLWMSGLLASYVGQPATTGHPWFDALTFTLVTIGAGIAGAAFAFGIALLFTASVPLLAASAAAGFVVVGGIIGTQLLEHGSITTPGVWSL